ncbi:MAG: PAS domain-containing protein [Rhodocyclaceae bacterium]|nr:PAS domain-containing protein [Rhodocyclaceae bacterium]
MVTEPHPTADETVLPRMSAAELAQAFAAFSQASEELSSAYGALQGQVSQLTERLSVLMEALPAGVLVLDRTEQVVQANRAAERLLGAGLAGQGWPTVESSFAPTETPGEWRHEAGAHAARLAVARTPLESGEGSIVLLHDISETHRMRLQVERNERLAAMGEMVAGLAHQLRTPLSAALLYVGNLSQPELGAPDRARIVDRALERLRLLERLIRDMLLFARGDTQERERFGACELAAELTHTLEPVARARQVVFRDACLCPDARLTGDRKALAGALTNLLENAVQATPAGGEVSLEVSREGELVRFRVRDNGKGMDEDLQSRIFEPFFTTRSEGTGLGLAIARSVARAHGGDIDVASVAGAGTTFTLSLPDASGADGSAAEDVHE